MPQESFFGNLGNQIGGDPLGSALLALGIGGTLLGREKKPKEQSIVGAGMAPHNEPPTMRPKPLNRKYVQNQPAPYTFENNAQAQFLEDANPETQFARGGHAVGGYSHHDDYMDGGYVDDDTGGVDDKVKTSIPEGSYVMDATTVSLLGDGNSDNGKVKIKKLEEDLPVSSYMPYHSKPRPIKAFLSGGEAVIKPAAVTAMGKGSNKKGAKELDKLRKNLRKQKGVHKLLPPKSKKITSYLKD